MPPSTAQGAPRGGLPHRRHVPRGVVIAERRWPRGPRPGRRCHDPLGTMPLSAQGDRQVWMCRSTLYTPGGMAFAGPAAPAGRACRPARRRAAGWPAAVTFSSARLLAGSRPPAPGPRPARSPPAPSSIATATMLACVCTVSQRSPASAWPMTSLIRSLTYPPRTSRSRCSGRPTRTVQAQRLDHLAQAHGAPPPGDGDARRRRPLADPRREAHFQAAGAALDVRQAHAGAETQLPDPVRRRRVAGLQGPLDVRDALRPRSLDVDVDRLGVTATTRPSPLRA